MARPKKTQTETEAIESPNLTPEERAIAQRAASQDTDWHTIREDELEDYSLSEDPYKLPPVAQKLQDEKKYAFRWCERTPKRIDQITRTYQTFKRWTLVTRTTLPELEDEVDGILGCVCRGDQALLFRPWFYHENEKRMKNELAESNYKSGSLEGKKQSIEDRDDDVRVTVGESAAIKSGDEIMYEDSGTDLGDLVAD
jgi:hypothetical protein